MWARLAAALAGIAASGAALYILLAEAIETGAWSMETKLLPIVVAVTILTGHLAGVAFRRWRIVSGLGFLIVFSAGTALTVIASVGRQTTAADAKHMSVEEEAKERKRLSQLAEASEGAMADTRRRYLRECPGYGAKHCASLEYQISMLEASGKGHRADIRALGAPKADDATAAKVAEVIRLLGGSATNVKETLETLRPFMWSLFFEITAILCFGFALKSDGVSNVGAVMEPINSNPPAPTPAPSDSPSPAPTPESPPIRGLRLVSNDGVPTLEYSGLQPPTPSEIPTSDFSRLHQLRSMANSNVVSKPQTELAEALKFGNRTSLREWLRAQEKEGHIQLETSRKGTRIIVK